ncbi:MAG: hypothetical protein ACRD68_08140, partial [Pyrinomonadaceae bacterium]
LTLELHRYDNTKAPPELVKMSDADKVRKSRCVHVQNADGDHGRAKLVVKKIDDKDWPDGTRKYQIVLNVSKVAGGGEVKLFKTEKKGTAEYPLTLSRSDLTKDRAVWVEGKTVTDDFRQVRIDVGLDRPADAHAPAEKKPKRNGDWVPLTVVEIEKVTPAGEFAAPSANYNADKYRQYVNLDAAADASDLTRGRKMKVKAGLSKKLKDVELFLRLVPPNKDPKNRATLPDDLKHVDEVKGPPVTNVLDKTDDKGVAEAELTLSRFGGDVYIIGAYLADDPIMGKAKPVKSKKVIVWRKIFSQITADLGAALPGRGKTDTAFEKTFLEVKEIDQKLITYKTDVAGVTFHKLWQFDPSLNADAKGDREVVCVGEHNKAKFHALFTAPAAKNKPKTHMIMCDAQWDPDPGTLQTFPFKSRTQVITYKDGTAADEDRGVFSPPLKGGALVTTGDWSWNDGTNTHTGTIADANVAVEKTRAGYGDLKVTLPATCTASVCTGCAGGTAINPTNAKKASLELQLKCATGPWAGESGQPGKPQCLIVVDPDDNTFNNTISHEIGHLFKAVREEKGWLNVPDHSDQYIKRGGQGSHCKKGATQSATEKDQDGKKVYDGGTCVMYHVAVGNVLFCDQCRLDVRI